MRIIQAAKQYALYLAWVVSLVATLGSLYFSEILGYEPCKLCWLQRICMYPQAILLGMACFKNDRRMASYLFPLSLIGGCISLYHYAEQKIPALAKLLPCTVGVPCNEDYIDWLGFITIPFLALIAFILMASFLWLQKRSLKEEEEEKQDEEYVQVQE
ncbi:disulfide oxidoreductase [Paenibacillus radicis (ex Xue et al. 2023)]|uniref:Disulfide oxidoreductase n=1 Tax=Paenibacillus radicis (ex Xue et al. 2023) TaxID=2972489 RepID=A0ABT1YHI0_9BACL|nr:disulfide oxidoreductase [Paenibacillus radicis (ex Xue et al. 2023)]MCR8632648.1 disulfide oxidoreductase [Paenibacillus radicis (ex Xue et al. 2023)]